jgi:hypothetical protein
MRRASGNYLALKGIYDVPVMKATGSAGGLQIESGFL